MLLLRLYWCDPGKWRFTQPLLALAAVVSLDSDVVDIGTKQKTCCWCQNKTKAMFLSYLTQVRSLPCFVTESLALIFVQNVGFVKVVKVSSSPSTRSSQRRRTTSLPFSTRRRCPRSRPQPQYPAPWGTGSSYPWGKSLGGISLFQGSLVFEGWRDHRTSEEREHFWR